MAKRDMTEAQFKAALKRQGFRMIGGGMWFEDTTGRTPDKWYGGRFWDKGRGYTLARRATLAKIISDRKEAEAQIKQRPA